MATDMNVWRSLLKDAVRGVSDRDLQRRSWLGIGPEVSSPIETFERILSDVDIEDYLKRDDTGLSPQQQVLGKNLVQLIRTELPFPIRNAIKPEDLIDDPRMTQVRDAAGKFLAVL